MIRRALTDRLKELAGWFPVVSLTGPRQSGKSTLVKSAFPEFAYINLEQPDYREAALTDPVGFLKLQPDHLIIDEAQYAPELFSMIQVLSDARGSVGQYVLTGSQNFLLTKAIQQSLAGRVGRLTLLPFSYPEAHGICDGIDSFMLAGGYPRMYDAGMPRDVFMRSYLDAYVERDVGGLLNVRNLAEFRRMLGILAHSVGGIVNYTSIASDSGVDMRTVKSWMSLLQASYIIFLLPPYYANGRKRLTKSPKLYFYDTGLLCSLLQIEDVRTFALHPKRGEVFENLVISERIKHHLNAGDEPVLYFYRDDAKREVDLLDCTHAAEPQAVEIKAGETYRHQFARHLTAVSDELGIAEDRRCVVYRGEMNYRVDGVQIAPARDFLLQR